jgi:hypothetical protein
VEQDGSSKSFFVPEATGRFPQGFNLGIDPLDRGVGYLILCVIQNSVGASGVSDYAFRLEPNFA